MRILLLTHGLPPESVGGEAIRERLGLLSWLNDRFVASHAAPAAIGHKTAYERAVKLMRSESAKVFDLDTEPDKVREAYGRNRFGQGCLLARRLVEQGVPFVEVTHGGNGAIGWDTHTNNFDTVKELSGTLDAAWATLMAELQSRGLLETTLIVWMGEFGRTPKIARGNGRDHWPNSWTTVLAGGGIKGGQVVGRTSASGEGIEDRPVQVPDLINTVCQALGVNPKKQNDSNVGRPIRIADPTAEPLREVLS